MTGCGQYRESAVRFGPDTRLTGIVTKPHAASAGAVHVLFVNAGIIHRVGPDRLYVDVARALAARGYPTLRFDLSGVGYSQAASGALPLTTLVLQDITAACDLLVTQHGASRVVVLGLCSGANHAMLAALEDARIPGLVLIDPSVVRTWQGRLLHYKRRLLHLPTLRELVLLRHPAFHRPLRISNSADVMRTAMLQVNERTDDDDDDAERQRQRFARTVHGLVSRGTRMLMVFTGGVNHIYNYRRQVFDLLGGIGTRGLLDAEYMPDADHTVSSDVQRAALIASISTWLDLHFPVAAPVARDAEPAAAPLRELLL